jgi:pantoate--beta-alanine ligase
VVAKLFNVVQPDIAIFGQKDYQQATLVRALIREFNFPIELRVLPTTRAADGLALSSRNRYLSSDDRKAALAVPRSLAAIVRAWRGGEKNGKDLVTRGLRILADHTTSVDYLTVVSPDSLEPVGEAGSADVVLVAARVAATRLIDNIVLGQPEAEVLLAAFPSAK